MIARNDAYAAGPSLLDAALRYVAEGWAVFPLGVRSKFPMIAKADGGHGHLDATHDEGRAREWWTRWPLANIGVATGETSGISPLDVDPKNGGDQSLAALVAKNGPFPPTLIAISGSGGTHLVFRHVAGMRRTVGFRPGLDYLGDGGYVVVAPSVHPCGGAYRWRPDVATIAEAPSWLVDAVRDARRPRAPSTGYRAAPLPRDCSGTSYGRSALQRVTLALSGAAAGTRNRELNAAAYGLGRLVAAGHLAGRDVEARLLEASARNGYLGESTETAVRAVITSGMAAGIEAGPRGPVLPWARRERPR